MKLKTKFIQLTSVAAVVSTLSGCAFLYQPDVQQGNYITQDMLDNVSLGMNKLEVEYYLGRPLLQDPFHSDRWDYFYSYRAGRDSQREEKNLVLLFENDRLVKIDGEIETQANHATTPESPALSKPNIDTNELAWYERIFM